MLRRSLRCQSACQLPRRAADRIDLVIVRVLDDLPTLDVPRGRSREHLRKDGGDCEVSVNDADVGSTSFLIDLRVLFSCDAGATDYDMLTAGDSSASIVERHVR